MGRVLAIAAAIWMGGLPALAQDGWGWSIIVPSVTGTDQLGTYFHNQRNAPAERGARPAAPATDPAALRFTPSPERRRANIDRFLAGWRGDAQSRRELEAVLRDPAFMPRLETELGRFGLRTDNLADAYAVWWINVWHAAHGVTGDPTQASVRAVKAQAERAMLAMPALARGGDDAGKQAMAEGLLVQAVLIGSAAEQAKADPAQLRQIGQVARRNARSFGLDLDAFTLTDAGFVPARAG